VQTAQTPKAIGGTGLLPPSVINLGSNPVKTQQLGTYSKIDKFVGGALPFGTKPFWKK